MTAHSNSKDMKPNTVPHDYDIAHLLRYGGENLQQQDPIADSVIILDFRNSDENERNISILLSSQGIPFYIERPKLGWTGTQIRMIVTVPQNRYPQATAILTAAASTSAIEIVEGIEGLMSR